MMEERLGAKPVFIQWPMGREEKFNGLIDVIREEAVFFDEDSLGRQLVREPVPEALRPSLLEQRQRLIETLAEHDDPSDGTISWRGGPLPVGDPRGSLRRATLSQTVVPVLCGSAFKNKGIQPLLDAIVDYLPAPDRRPTHYRDQSRGTGRTPDRPMKRARLRPWLLRSCPIPTSGT